eukprot:Partr_v1_DN28899_c1_g1_i3_m34159 putative Promotes mitochondrial protein synthesis. May act as a fidelity factor of the translation reaction, by catalyzing a one- codon backward translocation of tRNAs on improperly translocated ribosomes. Binds to mitochondrial ribosomes in a GTP-dependent manner (By similarity)
MLRILCYLPRQVVSRRMYSDLGSPYPMERIRNFCIIAHVDHGKSTLADRLMEATGAIKRGHNMQVLDKLQVERDRGITVKAQTVSLVHEHTDGESYLLNLIDTPGHVDFHYEVSRSMSACQGALLIVDSTQGIQAQTLANFHLADELGLTIVPVLNKIDLPHADVPTVTRELEDTLCIDSEECILISAKSGLNISQILTAIVERMPPPPILEGHGMNALLFDSWFDKYRGVVALVAIRRGGISKGDTLVSLHSGISNHVIETGMLSPHGLIPCGALKHGQVGYIITSEMKHPNDATIGDSFYRIGDDKPSAASGFKKPQSMVFAGIFPLSSHSFDNLQDAMDRLALNDASVQILRTTSNSLGLGFRCGFLGMLHLDVFRQRLENEFDLNVIITSPSIFYEILLKDGSVKIIDNPAEFPEIYSISEIREPVVPAKIISPEEYIGPIMKLSELRRGSQKNLEYLGNRVVLEYDFPLADIVENHFFNELKQISSGFASLSLGMEKSRFVTSDIVKVDVALNGENVDALSSLTHKSLALQQGRTYAQKLQKVIDRQLFEVSIQVMVSGKSIARETVKALRKNVTAKCYGGDITRKMKLLEKQKEGKKRMKTIGKIQISPEAFLSLVKK